ncbi:SRPBCC family protein [Actinomadura craniellae]|uniref:SRPBCC family protein n=1 Tax=Actinomadura craniellae TaxID=2231787 RepID=A0A365H541_9ACTN|nr:SRPBCC family protein [Actinomadura craniellae]RAY14211.1 SRPBCC family protein [Actinomadura craniellae]
MEREWVIEESVVVEAGPKQVYEAVTDLRRIGARSPECFAVWLRGRTVEPGTKFVGFNRVRWRVWFTNCRVSAAVPDEVFAFRVASFGIPVALWGYRVEGIGDGATTRLTEYWEDLRREHRGARLVSLLGRVVTGMPPAARVAANRRGMRATLARIKAELES